MRLTPEQERVQELHQRSAWTHAYHSLHQANGVGVAPDCTICMEADT